MGVLVGEVPRKRPTEKRYRFGHLWSPRDNLWQIANASSRTRTRVFAHLELVARVGGGIPLDVADFVLPQERAIRDWEEYVRARGDRAGDGSWATNYARL